MNVDLRGLIGRWARPVLIPDSLFGEVVGWRQPVDVALTRVIVLNESNEIVEWAAWDCEYAGEGEAQGMNAGVRRKTRDGP